MANSKSVRSVRSILSTRSNKSSVLERAFREEKKGDGDLHSFDQMLKMACTRFQCPFTVSVLKEVKPDYLKNLKHGSIKQRLKRISMLPEVHIPHETKPDVKLDVKFDLKSDAKPVSKTERKSATSSSVSNVDITFESMPVIAVTILYDQYNTLTEILITKTKDVPRSLLRIICLLMPYYQNLARITISRCAIDMYTIYKLSKILETSTITEICLDDSKVADAGYTMLLETAKLRYLSLCRCNIYDKACKSIAAKLHHADSAQNLWLLNLSSNHITDEGAKHISDALRTNRHLRYLNLADNRISDCGAGQILDVLIEFPLTYDEIVNKRRRLLEYLNYRNDLYTKYLAQLMFNSVNDDNQLRKKSPRPLKSKTSTRKDLTCDKVDEYIKIKAEMLTTETSGPFEDPFDQKSTKRIDGYIFSIGNMSLAYLNLAYNNLSYLSVRKLQNVVKYQTDYKSFGGLVKVVLEGNNFPISCPELVAVDEMLARYSVKLSVLVKK